MFTRQEDERVQRLLEEIPKFPNLIGWTERNVPIHIYDLRDLMNGDPHLNSLVFPPNGDIATSFGFEELVSLFRLDEKEIYEVPRRSIYKEGIAYPQWQYGKIRMIEFEKEHLERAGVQNKDLFIQQYVLHNVPHRESPFERILEMKPLDTYLGVYTAGFPLSGDGFLRDFYQEILDRNHSIIVHRATTISDSRGHESLIYIVSGVGNNSN